MDFHLREFKAFLHDAQNQHCTLTFSLIGNLKFTKWNVFYFVSQRLTEESGCVFHLQEVDIGNRNKAGLIVGDQTSSL
jgi:hypothetical protein